MQKLLVIGAPLALASLAIILTSFSPQRVELIGDESLGAVSIGLDHNAELAGNAKSNQAFLKAFGNYIPGSSKQASLQTAQGTTKLAQAAHAQHAAMSTKAVSNLNNKMAAQMQAQLTAGSQNYQLMTPHFVAALDAASQMEAKGTMLAQQDRKAQQQKETMDALQMTDAQGQPKAHVLPSDLRQKYAFTKSKRELGATHLETPYQAALQAQPMGATTQALSESHAQPSATGGAPSGAASADNSFLAASEAYQPKMTAEQLIQAAAMKQMNSLPAAQPAAPAPAPVQQLASSPPQQQQQQQQPMQMYAPTQQLAQPQYYGQPQYQQYPQYQQQYAPTQMAYQRPAQPQYTGYGYTRPAEPSMYSPAATQMTYQQPAQATQMYQPQPAYESQAMQQPAATGAMGGASTSGAAAQAVSSGQSLSSMPAGAKAPMADWRAPDATLKQGGHLNAAKKQKIKAQMEALRSQIMSDFKKNTRMADKALLMGPGL